MLERQWWFIRSSTNPSLLRNTGEPTGALKIFELACRVPWLRLEAKGYNTILHVDSRPRALPTASDPLKLLIWFDVSAENCLVVFSG